MSPVIDKKPFGDLLDDHFAEIITRAWNEQPMDYPKLFGTYEPPTRWERVRRWPRATIRTFRCWLGEKILPYKPHGMEW